MKDDSRKTENTILTVLYSLSENSLNNDTSNISVGTARKGDEKDRENLVFEGLDSDQQNADPESLFADPSLEWHDMVTGVSEGNPLEKKKNPLDQSSNTKRTTTKICSDTKTGTDTSHCSTSKLPKVLTVTVLVFNGKTKKYDIFNDLFSTSLKMYPHVTEGEKMNYFHSLMRGEALQTFANIPSTQTKTIKDIRTVYQRRFVGTKSMASAKSRWQSLMIDSTKQKVPHFLDDLQWIAKDAFGTDDPRRIDQIIWKGEVYEARSGGFWNPIDALFFVCLTRAFFVQPPFKRENENKEW